MVSRFRARLQQRLDDFLVDRYRSCRRLREGRAVRKPCTAADFEKPGLALAKTRLRDVTGEKEARLIAFR